MGCCSSLLHLPRDDNGDESVANLLDNDADAGDANAMEEAEAEGEELDPIPSPSAICRSFPWLFMSSLCRWPWYAFNIWDDWVFAKLVGRDGEQKFYASSIQANMCLPFPYMKKDGPVEGSAMAMVGRKLYVIGGVLRDGVVSNLAYECDLENLWRWRPVASMTTPRRNAVAIGRPDGSVLVFGGSQDNTAALAELLNPSRRQWTPLEVNSNHPAWGLDPPFQFVVVNDIAYVRNAGRGIVLCIMTSDWTHYPEDVAEASRAHQELFQHWCMDCNAAPAGRESNLLITCYVEMRRSSRGTDEEVTEEAVYSVRAYNPGTRSWLTIHGLPRIIQENAQRCQFMSLYRRRHRGKQGICIMLEGGLTISTFDLMYGTPNVAGEITYLEARADLRRPRPAIKKKWLLQTPHCCPPPPRSTGRYCCLMRPRRRRTIPAQSLLH